MKLLSTQAGELLLLALLHRFVEAVDQGQSGRREPGRYVAPVLAGDGLAGSVGALLFVTLDGGGNRSPCVRSASASTADVPVRKSRRVVFVGLGNA